MKRLHLSDDTTRIQLLIDYVEERQMVGESHKASACLF